MQIIMIPGTKGNQIEPPIQDNILGKFVFDNEKNFYFEF